MRTILNILWNVPGLGFVAAFFWALAGCLMALTVIGLPWAKACFTLANYTLAPFGREVVSRRDATWRDSIGTGGWGLVANVIWFVFVGSSLTVLHVPMAWATNALCFIVMAGLVPAIPANTGAATDGRDARP